MTKPNITTAKHSVQGPTSMSTFEVSIRFSLSLPAQGPWPEGRHGPQGRAI